jgi:hypothetical protein
MEHEKEAHHVQIIGQHYHALAGQKVCIKKLERVHQQAARSTNKFHYPKGHTNTGFWSPEICRAAAERL